MNPELLIKTNYGKMQYSDIPHGYTFNNQNVCKNCVHFSKYNFLCVKYWFNVSMYGKCNTYEYAGDEEIAKRNKPMFDWNISKKDMKKHHKNLKALIDEYIARSKDDK